jgi:hypothetical protein
MQRSVIFWFQAFAFKRNLCRRYAEDTSKAAGSTAASYGEYRHDDVQALKAAHFADGCGVIDLLLTTEWQGGALFRVGTFHFTLYFAVVVKTRFN